MCHRGATTRLGERLAGPIYLETLAKNIVKLKVWELEVLFSGAIRALAKTAVFSAQVTGMVDGTAVEATAPFRWVDS